MTIVKKQIISIFLVLSSCCAFEQEPSINLTQKLKSGEATQIVLERKKKGFRHSYVFNVRGNALNFFYEEYKSSRSMPSKTVSLGALPINGIDHVSSEISDFCKNSKIEFFKRQNTGQSINHDFYLSICKKVSKNRHSRYVYYGDTKQWISDFLEIYRLVENLREKAEKTYTLNSI